VEIKLNDQSVEFVEQIDRPFLEPFFNVGEMRIMSKLEL